MRSKTQEDYPLHTDIYQFLQNDIEFLSDSLFHALKLETTKNASKKISCCCQLDLCARNVDDISVVTWAACNATAKGLETTRETRVLSACGDPRVGPDMLMGKVKPWRAVPIFPLAKRRYIKTASSVHGATRRAWSPLANSSRHARDVITIRGSDAQDYTVVPLAISIRRTHWRAAIWKMETNDFFFSLSFAWK